MNIESTELQNSTETAIGYIPCYKQPLLPIKERYAIKKISSSIANDMVIRNHYLHRKAQVSYAFGLYEIDGNKDGLFTSDKLVGCITYGLPASPNVCRGVCGQKYFNEVIELTRLWIDDCVGKNGESYLIGNTIKMIDKPIIISYSEPEHGHLGIVYQATNFLYTGLTAKRTNRIAVDGSTKKHNRHECMKKDATVLVDRPRKHRYVYFNCDKRKNKELVKALMYQIEKYPKGCL